MFKKNTNEALMTTSSNAFHHGEKTGQELVIACREDGGGTAAGVYAIASMVSGLLNIMAMIVADQRRANPGVNDIQSFDPTRGITKETLLYSALLCNKITPEYDSQQHGCVSEMGPDQYWQAMEAYERLTGNQIDDFLTPSLAQTARLAGSRMAAIAKSDNVVSLH